VIPSGTWGVNRAQEAGCTYCAAGWRRLRSGRRPGIAKRLRAARFRGL